MHFKEIAKILKELPFMTTVEGKLIYNFVIRSGFQNILELGFAHGTSTCYLAAALDEQGSGSIVTIDNQLAKSRKPNIFKLFELTGLGNYVNPIFADNSYTWELMKIIDKQTVEGLCKPIYDFCFIDGAHTWEVDGLVFFLVEKLLKPGGWILFDDVYWTFEKSPTLKDTERVQKMPRDQKTTPQVERIFSLLVSQHHNFENIKIYKEWGWAQKKTKLDKSRAVTSKMIDKMQKRQLLRINIIDILKKIRNFVQS
ncbi:MAG: class I SAM-dependent methyltransferase [Promethearchaeota archaeon]|jgi:predicted O-methyltransferase YrrM